MNSFVFLQNVLNGISSFLLANGAVLVSGVIGIIGAMIGGNIAAKSAMDLEQWRTLRDAYADFFASFYTFMLDNSGQNVLSVIVANERASLLCSNELQDLLQQAQEELFENPRDQEKLKITYARLRESAKNDLEQRRKGKYRA